MSLRLHDAVGREPGTIWASLACAMRPRRTRRTGSFKQQDAVAQRAEGNLLVDSPSLNPGSRDDKHDQSRTSWTANGVQGLRAEVELCLDLLASWVLASCTGPTSRDSGCCRRRCRCGRAVERAKRKPADQPNQKHPSTRRRRTSTRPDQTRPDPSAQTKDSTPRGWLAGWSLPGRQASKLRACMVPRASISQIHRPSLGNPLRCNCVSSETASQQSRLRAPFPWNVGSKSTDRQTDRRAKKKNVVPS
ncbi:uncharacterized protein J3D65DRAFT_621050 [Phyllosticta citribraziliensis]|uniref:Uncharacterized protein n=1 Tax=Phyllosticta citribraziliensis TaxID=989973 RepID=A0ABR1LTW2_9PEZI